MTRSKEEKVPHVPVREQGTTFQEEENPGSWQEKKA